MNALCQRVSSQLYLTTRHHCLLEQHALATLTAFSPCSCCLSPCREIPLELRQRSRGGQVNLDMEDHRDEDFSKPKLTFRAFGGEGQKLGRWDWWVLFFYLTWFVNLYSSLKQQRNSVQGKVNQSYSTWEWIILILGLECQTTLLFLLQTLGAHSALSQSCLSCLII